MPVVSTSQIMKLSFGGSAWEEQELWSFGVHIGLTQGGDLNTQFTQVDLQGIYNLFASYLQNTIAGDATMSSNVVFNEVRLALLSERGQQIGDSRVYSTSNGITGADDQPYIPQHSIAITTQSDIRTGKTAKGRFYLPPGWGLPGANGNIAAGQRNRLAADFAGLISDINDRLAIVNPELVVVNFSKYTPTNPGQLNPVISVRVGSVIDTQRRRRNGLTEVYASEPVV